MAPFHNLFPAMNCVNELYREHTLNENVKKGPLKHFQQSCLQIYVLKGIIIFLHITLNATNKVSE
jgi:hypothetical protein